MILTFQQIEPISDEHHDKIIAAFNMFFIDGGGWPDGNGDGVLHGFSGDGGCVGNKCPEEWQAD